MDLKGIELMHMLSVRVTEAQTALAMGSGDLPVLATPAMIALMECAAKDAVAPELDPGMTTVGTRIEVSHVKAVPVGREVIVSAELTDSEDRRLEFEVTVVTEESELVGKGIHTRFVVDRERFMQKL